MNVWMKLQQRCFDRCSHCQAVLCLMLQVICFATSVYSDSLCDMSMSLIHDYLFYLLIGMNSTSCSSQKGYESEATLLQLSSAVLQRFVILNNNLLFSNYFHLKLLL